MRPVDLPLLQTFPEKPAHHLGLGQADQRLLNLAARPKFRRRFDLRFLRHEQHEREPQQPQTAKPPRRLGIKRRDREVYLPVSQPLFHLRLKARPQPQS